MAATRKAPVPMAEQIRLINECRKSGMTDADWCRENDIAVSTFYNWVSRYMQKAIGYTMTGDTSLECLFVMYGPTTRNGKTTTIETILRVMGEYGCSAKPDLYKMSRPNVQKILYKNVQLVCLLYVVF